MENTESIFTTTDKALWYLQSGLNRDFAPSTVAHVYFLGMRRRRPAAAGSFAQLLPIIAKGMEGYALFRVIYRPEHPYGYIVRVECLDKQQMRVYEAKRRLKPSEAGLLAIVLPTREGSPLLIGRCFGVSKSAGPAVDAHLPEF
jgi:hypothetical protein